MVTATERQTQSYSADAEVDTTNNPTAQKLLKRCQDFFAEVENLTPGKDLENYLNAHYGPGNAIYENLCSLTRQCLQEGWVANIDIDGRHYRRSKDVFSGQYRSHPYGEINCVVQIDKTAELKGMHGWQSAGWTSPGAGTHHYPQVRGGALIALFFLPAGRISYTAKPEDAQPVSL